MIDLLIQYQNAIYGGLFISISCIILLAFLGKIAGISGIFSYLVSSKIAGVNAWHICFIIGLILGGTAYAYWGGINYPIRENFPTSLLIISGLLVGYGTQLGNGCTSGHGICGISRLSKRSIIATVIFMGVAVITTLIMKVVS